MTQQDKQLLLQDLSSRLPYGVIINSNSISGELLSIDKSINGGIVVANRMLSSSVSVNVIENIKPYLRPMSSMTKEEENEYKMFIDYSYNDFTSESFPCVYVDKINDYLDWLNAHQFDYRGLIPMGLALPATEGIYNIK